MGVIALAVNLMNECYEFSEAFYHFFDEMQPVFYIKSNGLIVATVIKSNGVYHDSVADSDLIPDAFYHEVLLKSPLPWYRMHSRMNLIRCLLNNDNYYDEYEFENMHKTDDFYSYLKSFDGLVAYKAVRDGEMIVLKKMDSLITIPLDD